MRRAFNGSYPITTPFGEYNPAYANYPGSKHPGTDYGMPQGTQLLAGMEGVVTIYDRDPGIKTGRGKEVVISNDNKQRKACHMSRIDVKNGDYVKEGQHIGLAGSTGYSSGPHLHDELLINGVYVPLEDNLKEEVPMPNDGDIDNAYLKINNRKATEDEKKFYRGKGWSAGDGLYYGKLLVDYTNLKAAYEKLANSSNGSFKPVNEQLYRKEG